MNALADLSALTTAMTTTGLVDPAAKAALGLGPREWPKVVRIEISSAGAQAVKLSVNVDPQPNELKQTEPAGALLRELVSRAKAVVNQSVETRREEIKMHLDEMEKRRAENRTLIESLRKRIRGIEASGYLGFAGPADTVATQRRQLESELAAKRPRIQAINQVLKEEPAQGQPDEINKALRELVAAREALVAGLEKAVDQGKAEVIELLRARAALAEARVRTAEAGRIPPFSPSRNLRDELANLLVDVTALDAQLKALPAAPAESARPHPEDAQQLRAELSRAEREYNSSEMQYQQVQREFDQLASPPSLVILDGQLQ
jgi:hypothetical protein